MNKPKQQQLERRFLRSQMAEIARVEGLQRLRALRLAEQEKEEDKKEDTNKTG